jgi:hypothetical protein
MVQVLGIFDFPKATLSPSIDAAINIQIVSLKGKHSDRTKQGRAIHPPPPRGFTSAELLHAPR